MIDNIDGISLSGTAKLLAAEPELNITAVIRTMNDEKLGILSVHQKHG